VVVGYDLDEGALKTREASCEEGLFMPQTSKTPGAELCVEEEGSGPYASLGREPAPVGRIAEHVLSEGVRSHTRIAGLHLLASKRMVSPGIAVALMSLPVGATCSATT
jgi:hypothetical protein